MQFYVEIETTASEMCSLIFSWLNEFMRKSSWFYWRRLL